MNMIESLLDILFLIGQIISVLVLFLGAYLSTLDYEQSGNCPIKRNPPKRVKEEYEDEQSLYV